MTTQDEVERAHAVLRRAAEEEQRSKEDAFKKAAAHGFVVITESAQDAARYYGLTYGSVYDAEIKQYRDGSNCDVVTGAYVGEDCFRFAVIPRPGFEHLALDAPERARRANNKLQRAARHKLFARVRRMLARKEG